MLLRSSSTPVLGSLLLSSISESPNNHHYQPELIPQTASKHPPTTIPHSLNKVSFHRTGSQNFTTFSCNSSPVSPAVSELSCIGLISGNGFQRTQSEGNLEGLANASSNNVDEFSLSKPLQKFPRRPSNYFLETIPSFSFHNSSRYVDSDEEEEKEETEENNELFNNAFRAEERFEAVNELNIEKQQCMGYAKGYGDHMIFNKAMEGFSPQMYLARGLGVTEFDLGFDSGKGTGLNNGGDGGGSGCGCRGGGSHSGRDDKDNNLEEHYKRMVEDNPGNPLFLRNYAQFLYQTKQDLYGAEEYYSRAILADPNDGEILSQYAKLVWELHHDIDRATSYFERAAQAATEDSHVHAAYASFLWEIEDDEDEDEERNDTSSPPPLVHRGAMASATA